jgi:Domain of unknown function (DUF6894)
VSASEVRVHCFFHVHNGKLAYEDEVGHDISSPEEAKADAMVIARDLAEDDDWHGCSVVVTGEGGTEIARVPIAK